MAAKQNKLKEKVVKDKKNTIEKLNKLIDSSVKAVELKVGDDFIKIKEMSDDRNTNKDFINPKESIEKNMLDNEIKNKPQEDISFEYSSDDTSIPFEESMDNTEVYDDGDLASVYERGFIQDALNKHKEKLSPESHPDFDGETCLDCGLDIPELRLKMGKIRCVICQDKLEKRKKLYA